MYSVKTNEINDYNISRLL